MNNTPFREGRTKLLRLTNQRLVDVITSRLKQAASVESLCLPADMSVHGAWYDIERDGWMVRLASAEWPVVNRSLVEGQGIKETILEWPSAKHPVGGVSPAMMDALIDASAMDALRNASVAEKLPPEAHDAAHLDRLRSPWNFANALADKIDADLCALAGKVAESGHRELGAKE